MRLLALLVLICAHFTIFADNLTPLNLDTTLQTFNQFLEYHVEHKKFTPTLAKRTLKLFIEQFDPEKQYLLQEEVEQFLNLDPKDLEQMTYAIEHKEMLIFQKLMRKINEAISRCKKIREEIYRECILKKELNQKDLSESFVSYPCDERSIRERVERKALRFLFAEAKLSSLEILTPELKEKIFSLLEKKLTRAEEAYCFIDRLGNRLSSQEKESVLCTHFLKAFAKSLDAHSAYFTQEEALDLRACLEKQFEGVGVVLREGIYGVQITDLIDGGPAFCSKQIQIGDWIRTINGVAILDKDYQQVLSMMKGEVGSKLTLGLEREGEKELIEVTLKREKILLQSDRLTWSYEPCGDGIIGKIVLSSFYESSDGDSSDQDLRYAIKELKKKGKLNGLILDFRTNSGGFLTQAVKVAGLFIKAGVVVVSKYSQGKTSYLRDLDAQMFYEGPLLVLTSKASASAAEIVAQALQDYGTAIIVGDERTYGKGTIQYQNVTDKTAQTFFKVTVGKYYTVSGKTTQIEGVKADIVVPTAFYSWNIGEQYLEYSLAADNIASFYIDPLHDVDESRKAWFQKNYLPYLQTKDHRWVPYFPLLAENSSARVKNDKDYQNFLRYYNRQKGKAPSKELSFGHEDPPLLETTQILKDMLYLKQEKAL